jgi:hypothetical protein
MRLVREFWFAGLELVADTTKVATLVGINLPLRELNPSSERGRLSVAKPAFREVSGQSEPSLAIVANMVIHAEQADLFPLEARSKQFPTACNVKSQFSPIPHLARLARRLI